MKDIAESICSFTDDVVSYLYDEQSIAERTKFESHLVDCGACTDEFAELSFARYSVFEWNRDEFVGLKTPSIVIPYEAETVGWFAGLREAVSFNWLAPAAVAATLLVVFGVAFFNTASLNQEQPLIAANSPQMIDVQTTPLPEIVVARSGDTQKETVVVAKNVERKPDTVKATVTRKRAPQVAVARSANTAERPTRPVAVPEMTAEVEDDDSLRLADLFDTIDSK